MKKLILAFLLYFPLNSLIAQDVLPAESIIASQRIVNDVRSLDFVTIDPPSNAKMNVDYVYTLNSINDNIIISPDYDTIFSKNEFIFNEIVVVQYNKTLNVENVLQIWSECEISVWGDNLKVFDDKLWIVGRCRGDILHIGDHQFDVKNASESEFFICLDEHLNYKSHFFIEGSNYSIIEQYDDVIYIAGNTEGRVIFNKDTLTTKVNSSFLLAIKDDNILWKKVFDKSYRSSLEISPDNNILVHGLAFDGLVINDKKLSERKNDGNYYFAIFDRTGEIQWFQAGQTIRNVTFGSSNTIYCIGRYRKDSTIIGDTFIFKENLDMYSTYLAEFDWKSKKLKWVNQFKGKYNYISELDVENDILTVIGYYGGSLEFQDYKLDANDGLNLFVYRRFLLGNTQMFTLGAESSEFKPLVLGSLLDADNNEILIGGNYQGKLLSGDHQLDGKGTFLALIDAAKINELSGIFEPKHAFTIFPNPIQKNDYLGIISKFESEILNIKMVNNLGQIIFTTNQKGSFQIPANLQSGIYYLMIEDDERSELHKLVVE